MQRSSFRGICSQMRELERCTGSLRSRYCTHACCASHYGIASQPSAKPGQFDSGYGEIESSMLLPPLGRIALILLSRKRICASKLSNSLIGVICVICGSNDLTHSRDTSATASPSVGDTVPSCVFRPGK